jgi:hypothetical protein
MTWRFSIQSRKGNIALGVLGAVEAIGALVVFILYLMQHRDGVSTIDKIFLLGLLGSTVIAAWLCANARANLEAK